jgi:hypothetical protein
MIRFLNFFLIGSLVLILCLLIPLKAVEAGFGSSNGLNGLTSINQSYVIDQVHFY